MTIDNYLMFITWAKSRCS